MQDLESNLVLPSATRSRCGRVLILISTVTTQLEPALANESSGGDRSALLSFHGSRWSGSHEVRYSGDLDSRRFGGAFDPLQEPQGRVKYALRGYAGSMTYYLFTKETYGSPECQWFQCWDPQYWIFRSMVHPPLMIGVDLSYSAGESDFDIDGDHRVTFRRVELGVRWYLYLLPHLYLGVLGSIGPASFKFKSRMASREQRDDYGFVDTSCGGGLIGLALGGWGRGLSVHYEASETAFHKIRLLSHTQRTPGKMVRRGWVLGYGVAL